jgi:hypothetical protein
VAFDEADDRCVRGNPDACDALGGIADEGRTLEAATIALGAAAGAAAAATVVLGLYADFDGDAGEGAPVAVGISPLVGVDGAIAGAFLDAAFRF